MAYFPNGTAGDMFEAEWCNRCAHEDEEKGCPVMLAHILFCYELCNNKEHPGKVMLDMLIPEDCSSCTMFVRRQGPKGRSSRQLNERLAELRGEAKATAATPRARGRE